MPGKPPSMDQAYIGEPTVLQHKASTVYTDGLAVFPRDLPMRRAAFGVWIGENSVHNHSQPLPGKVQTAYRAELHAIVHVAERYTENISIIADCLGVVNEANRILKGGSASKWGKHSDLWQRWEHNTFMNLGGITD
eukprot:13404998-Heterocapsa_arctica.AAC.1